MMRWLVMICLLAVVRADDTFEKGNAAYEAGNFMVAADVYERVLVADGPQVGVLQNLGNAYFGMGEYGRAILAFERALLLEPRNPDLRANLKLARDEAAVFEDRGAGWQERFLGVTTRRGWSVIALGGALLVPLGAGLWVFLKRGRAIGLASGAVGLVAVGISLTALEMRSGEADEAIVVWDPVRVRISPFETAEERGSLAAGKRVRVGAEKDGYRWVEADGLEGWVVGGEVELLRWTD